MRGWLQGKTGLILVTTASVLLTSCLVDHSKSKPLYKITSSNLPVYKNGDTISMLYERYNGQTSSGGITMSWQQSIVPRPFNLSPLSALRFVFQEQSGSSVQYITQDANGSIFLRAFEGQGSVTPGSQTHMFWPNQGPVLAIGDELKPVQVFWSPLGENLGEHAANNALDFNIMGECDPTSCYPFGSLAAVAPKPGEAVGYFVDSATQITSTPLGDFETYHIRYAGSISVTNFPTSFNPSTTFDYRASCLRPGQNGTANFLGEVWVYPPIGPVKVSNYCFPSIGTSINYSAVITGTNLPF